MSSGADLARTALAAAKAAARNRPAARPERPRLARVQRGTGRDPVGLGTALTAIAGANGWDLQTRAGSITDRWADLAPRELRDTVRPVHYDGEQRVLHLLPATQAAATALRYGVPRLVAHLNEKLGADVVAQIRVAPVGGLRKFTAVKPDEDPGGSGPSTGAGGPGNFTAVKSGPSGAPPSEAMQAWRQGYREQRAHAAAEPDQSGSPWFEGAYGRLREPEQLHRDGVIAQEDAAEQARGPAARPPRTPPRSPRPGPGPAPATPPRCAPAQPDLPETAHGQPRYQPGPR